jgi:glycosyltransferase involved in cell wall biosynthesis
MRSGRSRLLESVESQKIPADFLYGFDSVKHVYSGSKIIEFHSRVEGTIDRIFEYFEQFVSRFLLFRLRTYSMFKIRREISENQIVVSNIDSIGLSIALLRLLGLVNCQQIHISQGLTNDLDQQSDSLFWNLKSFLSKFLILVPESFIVLGSGARDSLSKHKLREGKGCKVLQFGVDADFWHPESPKDEAEAYILSVGSDAGRDYETLLRCNFDLPLKIVTRQNLQSSKSAEIISEITDEELRELYRKAKCVVVPLKNIPQPSGQSVALQAMSSGTPVVLTKTIGFWDPDRIKESEHLLFVTPYDQISIEHAVKKICENQDMREQLRANALDLVSKGYTHKHFGEGLVQAINSLLRSSLVEQT